ncbi:MAG: N-formylglutamate deformylase [Sphingomonadales bacterium]|nr:N-formylglutamate deformylase [Sphingomonadales bacterium]
MTPVSVIRGSGPVVLGQPHAGTGLPDGIQAQLNEVGCALTDTDWHVDRLYDGLLADATIVRANFHRYVIDANRDPSGESLYPGRNTTGLVPRVSFDGAPIWITPPPDREVEARRLEFHGPYHAALQAEVDRVRSAHGLAVLYDCHSIRSEIPYLFEGRLPDLNIGDNDGAACAPALTRAVAEICGRAEGFTSVVNGRFRGGWTTRHYGRPADGVHAIQMEIAQACYLEAEEAPFDYSEEKAARLREVLAEILGRIDALARTGHLNGAEHERQAGE